MKAIITIILFVFLFQVDGRGQAARACPADRPRIEWNYSTMKKLADTGGYPRMKKLADDSLLIIYQDYLGDVDYKRSYDGGRTWSEPCRIFTQFVYSDLKGESTVVKIANPEIYQLKNGDLVVACNYRPEKEEIAPYAIVIRRSIDDGKTWLAPQLLYSAAPRFKDGCWEPSFLQLPDSELQVYFANENPYRQSDEQEISVLSSYDNGKTWTEKPRTVSFRKDRRDGMPVATIIGDEIVVVIEDNNIDRFKPYIVRNKLSENWKSPVLADSGLREYCLIEQMNDSVYMGAPYILRLPHGEALISYQTNENRQSDWEFSTMEVAIGDKSGRSFGCRTQPFPVPLDKEAKWGSLTLVNDSTVAALTSSNRDSEKIAPWIIFGHIKYGD